MKTSLVRKGRRVSAFASALALLACDTSPDEDHPMGPSLAQNLEEACVNMSVEQCEMLRAAIRRLITTPDPACSNIGWNMHVHNANDELIFDPDMDENLWAKTQSFSGREFHGYSIYLGPRAFMHADELYDTLAHEGFHHMGHNNEDFAWSAAASCLAMAPDTGY